MTAPIGTPPPPMQSNSAGVELTFTAACATVALLALAITIVQWRRGGSPLGPLILIGAMLSCVQEPMVDTLGNMYIPPSHYTLFTTYGREMPWFAPFGYGLYFGIPMIFALRLAARGAPAREFQRLFAATIALELVFELIAVNGGFYRYYGDQALRIFDLPLHWITLNMAAGWVAAAVLNIARPQLQGRWYAFVPLITLCSITASYYAQGWPIFSALHAQGISSDWRAVASVATTAIGLAIIQASIHVLAAPRHSPARVTAAVAR